jgi:hypothetical protein
MPATPASGDDRHKIVPLLLFSAAIISFAPFWHPKNTCSEWLTKWGQLSSDPLWLPVHQFTMAAFLVLAGAAILFPMLGKRSSAAIIGGGVLGVGALVEGGAVLIHASAAATLGRAFIAARTPDLQAAIRAAAEAFVSYDESAHSVGTALVSFGCCMLILALVQEKIVSPIAGIFLAGLGTVWAAHRYHVFNKLGFSIPETVHWNSLALWLVAFAIILHFHAAGERKRAAATEPEDAGHLMVEAVPEA